MKKIFILVLCYSSYITTHPLKAALQKFYTEHALWNTALVFAHNPHICFPLLKILTALSTEEQIRILFWLRHISIPQKETFDMYRNNGLQKFKSFILELIEQHEKSYLLNPKNMYLKELLEDISQNNEDAKKILIKLIGECNNTQDMLETLEVLKQFELINKKLCHLYLVQGGTKQLYNYLQSIKPLKI